MVILLRVLIDLFRLGLSNVSRKYTHHRATACMNGQHYLCRLLPSHTEKPFQYMYHEFHRRVVIIEDDDLVHRRSPELGFGGRSRETRVSVLVLITRSTTTRQA